MFFLLPTNGVLDLTCCYLDFFGKSDEPPALDFDLCFLGCSSSFKGKLINDLSSPAPDAEED
jgi:hypothetical protein